MLAVLGPEQKPSTEAGKLKPWTAIAEFKLRAEQELAAIGGLNYIIVRPAIVYGVSDMMGLSEFCVVVHTPAAAAERRGFFN